MRTLILVPILATMFWSCTNQSNKKSDNSATFSLPKSALTFRGNQTVSVGLESQLRTSNLEEGSSEESDFRGKIILNFSKPGAKEKIYCSLDVNEGHFVDQSALFKKDGDCIFVDSGSSFEITTPALPAGGTLVQVLVLSEGPSFLAVDFIYGEGTADVGSDDSVNVVMNSRTSASAPTIFSGRYLNAANSGPTGELNMYFTADGYENEMLAVKEPMVAGWMHFVPIYSEIKIDYRYGDESLFDGAVNQDDLTKKFEGTDQIFGTTVGSENSEFEAALGFIGPGVSNEKVCLNQSLRTSLGESGFVCSQLDNDLAGYMQNSVYQNSLLFFEDSDTGGVIPSFPFGGVFQYQMTKGGELLYCDEEGNFSWSVVNGVETAIDSFDVYKVDFTNVVSLFADGATPTLQELSANGVLARTLPFFSSDTINCDALSKVADAELVASITPTAGKLNYTKAVQNFDPEQIDNYVICPKLEGKYSLPGVDVFRERDNHKGCGPDDDNDDAPYVRMEGFNYDDNGTSDDSDDFYTLATGQCVQMNLQFFQCDENSCNGGSNPVPAYNLENSVAVDFTNTAAFSYYSDSSCSPGSIISATVTINAGSNISPNFWIKSNASSGTPFVPSSIGIDITTHSDEEIKFDQGTGGDSDYVVQ